MKQQTLLIKMLLALAPVAIGSLAFSEEKKEFVPSTEPVFNTAQAKPNIHMVLDDSGSMKSRDILDRPGGRYILRTKALDDAVQSLLYKYRDKAYLGITLIYQYRNESGLIQLPLDDYSKMSEYDFKWDVIDRISRLLERSPGNTPIRPAVYDTLKMFRGMPVSARGGMNANGTIQYESYRARYYEGRQLETPLRYRCQQNHMIVMTDGQPYGDTSVGIAEVDRHLFGRFVNSLNTNTDVISNGVILSSSVELGRFGSTLGYIAANTDLRDAFKPKLLGLDPWRREVWGIKDKDDAGKDWHDEFSTKMPITVHSVSLYIKPTADVYTELTSASKGMNLGFEKNKGTAQDLLLAFDTIFSAIIKSTSSTKAMNDKANADILFGAPKRGDLSSMGAIRYDTTYNFRQRFGTIRAMVPYISDWTEDASGKKIPQVDAAGKPKQATLELWNTDQTVKSNQGRYVTLGGLLSDDRSIRAMNEIYKKAYPDSGNNYDRTYVTWLTDHEVTTHAHNLRGRLTPIGSVTNSDIKLANKDELYIDITPKKMGNELRENLVQWLLFKAKNQPVNHLVVGDNNGFINFINAERGLARGYRAGERNTAYFPKMLASRIDDIAKVNRSATLVMEGRTNFVDAKVGANQYATIGLTSMGSGGKGLVGYSIFEGTTNNGKLFTATSTQIKPLFEIINEGPTEFRTKGFENLGYTYSGFEFFNKTSPLNGVRVGQAVAVFGNGFGAQKSSLYFIDAHTGEKIREIVLNPQGGGASTPSMLVRAEGAGQMVDRIYVGDYSGTLYRVDFNGKGLKDSDVTVTALFKAPEKGFGQSAISIKPLLLKNDITGKVTVYFGTGMAASKELDRGEKSLVEHSIYAVVDSNQTSAASTAKASAMSSNAASVLLPVLTQKDLSPGNVEYANKANVNYTDTGTHQLEIKAPANVANKDGWYLRLIADGEKSGERVIQEPKYDARHKAITFSTWGVHEREGGKPIEGLDDPCLSDAAFGKSLAIDVKTGGASNKIGLSNKGKTNNAPGGLTGDELYAAPEGNSSTKIDDIKKIDSKVAEDLIVAVGEENSTHATDPEGYAAYCEGDLTGGLECDLYDRSLLNQKVLDPKRIGIQKIFSF